MIICNFCAVPEIAKHFIGKTLYVNEAPKRSDVKVKEIGVKLSLSLTL